MRVSKIKLNLNYHNTIYTSIDRSYNCGSNDVWFVILDGFDIPVIHSIYSYVSFGTVKTVVSLLNFLDLNA